ncbi:hypothetical protein [Nocardia asteroides]|uniref:hypothetical protein n=1 Tax=Nocardia asteroides TaxID=1824 RepID=UPI001E3E74B4|nr:hypothetical protein [Nocardia asteroides]UGT53621.1 hypothetical protein LTT85_23460 [Nocardia asteroides]
MVDLRITSPFLGWDCWQYQAFQLHVTGRRADPTLSRGFVNDPRIRSSNQKNRRPRMSMPTIRQRKKIG